MNVSLNSLTRVEEPCQQETLLITLVQKCNTLLQVHIISIREHKITAGHWPISGHLSTVTMQNVMRLVLPSEQSIARVLWVGSRHV